MLPLNQFHSCGKILSRDRSVLNAQGYFAGSNIKIRGHKIVAFSGLTYMVALCPKNLF